MLSNKLTPFHPNQGDEGSRCSRSAGRIALDLQTRLSFSAIALAAYAFHHASVSMSSQLLLEDMLATSGPCFPRLQL